MHGDVEIQLVATYIMLIRIKKLTNKLKIDNILNVPCLFYILFQIL